MDDRLPGVLEVARVVRRAAERDLTARVWVPTRVEQQIAVDVARAARCPAVRGGPPHVGLAVGERVLRLASWAAAIRLAMAAGGWQLAEADLPPTLPDGPIDLPRLLTAVYGPARVIERWSEQMHGLAEVVADVDEAHLAEAEHFFDGLYSVVVTLHVIASGDLDT